MGNISSTQDLNKWTFYFNYQSDTCEDPPAEPNERTLVGASKLASSSNPSNIGSDFYLVRLNNKIPSAYNAFYCGWDRSNNPSVSGVGIHHPEGDIKKISTYTEQLTSGSWQSTPGTHWIVKWSATQNGFGVTERGSSGSAIFSSGGLVTGTLTGGESSCTNTNGADYYGKISFSWESNGTADSMQLKPWLDPLNEGRMSMEGSFNDKMAVSDFEADTTTVVVGGELDFYDRSSGNPTTWEWNFEGGEPSSSSDQNPKGIRYSSFGKFSVKLTVTNQYGADTLTKVDYIDVKALVYPNPSNGYITIFTHSDASDLPVSIEIFNLAGVLVREFRWERFAGAAIQLELPRDGNFFIIRMTEGDQVQVNKVVVVRVKQD